MDTCSGGISRSNSSRNKYVLNFQDVGNVSVEKLVEKLSHQKKSCSLKYTLFKVTESDIVIFVYPVSEKKPKLSEFENFNSFKEYRVFTELNDIIKFNRAKKFKIKKANIRIAETEDNKSVYWIKYI